MKKNIYLKSLTKESTSKNSTNYKYFLIIILMIIIFITSANSIIEIKFLELKFYINKEQLLNYELSSKVLREKMKNIIFNKDDFNAELRNNILESTIMNSETQSESQQLTTLERTGLVIVNSVRVLSLSEKLSFLDDSKDMYKIQYAFYLERTKKFSLAIKQYEDISSKLKTLKTNENGFVLLHLGFCYIMIGDTNKALEKLYLTEDLFSGSQFAEFARVLINVIMENDKKSKEIDNLKITPSEKANLYYETGRYRDTLTMLDSVQNRTSQESYIRARSLEELGNISSATNEYITLIEKKDNSVYAKQANRRVFMIGTLYEKNSELTDYSKQNAVKFGDSEFIDKVEAADTLMKENLVVKKLNSDDFTNSTEKAILEEIKSDFVELNLKKEKEFGEIKSIVTSIMTSRQILPIPNLIIIFNDGRTIRTPMIDVEENLITASNFGFIIKAPINNIEEIRIDSKQNFEKFMIATESEDESQRNFSKIISLDSEFYGITQDKKVKLNQNSKYKIFTIEIDK